MVHWVLLKFGSLLGVDQLILGANMVIFLGKYQTVGHDLVVLLI